MLANILCVLMIDGSAGCFLSANAETCGNEIVMIHEALDDLMVMATCDPKTIITSYSVRPRARPIR